VDRAERSAATALKASRIACRMASRCANVNEFCSDAILARDSPAVESFYVPTPRTTKTGPFGAGPCTLAGTFGGLIV
jgi:hypothetical protein